MREAVFAYERSAPLRNDVVEEKHTEERLLRRVEEVGEPVTVTMIRLVTSIQLGLTTSLVRTRANFQGP